MRHTSETQGIQESKIFCALLNIWGQLSIQTHECLYYQQNPSIPLRSPSLSPSLKRLKKWMLNIWQPCKYEIVGLDNFLIKKCHFQAWFRFLIVILYKWCKSQIDLMGIWLCIYLYKIDIKKSNQAWKWQSQINLICPSSQSDSDTICTRLISKNQTKSKNDIVLIKTLSRPTISFL